MREFYTTNQIQRRTMGEGVKKFENFADVVNGCSLFSCGKKMYDAADDPVAPPSPPPRTDSGATTGARHERRSLPSRRGGRRATTPLPKSRARSSELLHSDRVFAAASRSRVARMNALFWFLCIPVRRSKPPAHAEWRAVRRRTVVADGH